MKAAPDARQTARRVSRLGGAWGSGCGAGARRASAKAWAVGGRSAVVELTGQPTDDPAYVKGIATAALNRLSS